MKRRWKLILSVLMISTAACSKDTVSDPATELSSSTQSEHFTFVLYDGLTQDIIPPVLKRLEDNYARILDDLKIAKMDPVKIQIWNNETEFQNVIKKDLGTNFWGATGYVYGKSDVRVLNRGSAAQIALHEFSHTVSLYVNSRIGNNPRWLWEAVAIYESGELVNPKTISYLTAGNFPTLNELNTDYNSGNQKIYSVGYLLSEYIIQKWGKDKYVNLIKTNGNVQTTFGLSDQEFEAGWKDFVTKKYL